MTSLLFLQVSSKERSRERREEVRSASADQRTWKTELGARGKARTKETLTTGGRRGPQVAFFRSTKARILKYMVNQIHGKSDYFLAPLCTIH